MRSSNPSVSFRASSTDGPRMSGRGPTRQSCFADLGAKRPCLGVPRSEKSSRSNRHWTSGPRDRAFPVLLEEEVQGLRHERGLALLLPCGHDGELVAPDGDDRCGTSAGDRSVTRLSIGCTIGLNRADGLVGRDLRQQAGQRRTVTLLAQGEGAGSTLTGSKAVVQGVVRIHPHNTRSPFEPTRAASELPPPDEPRDDGQEDRDPDANVHAAGAEEDWQ